MTNTSNSRLAGVAFLLYIATGLTDMALTRRAASGANTAEKLANIAENATTMRFSVLLILLMFACALILGVTLYSLTRNEDRDLALLGLSFRVAEGVLAALASVRTLGVVTLAATAAAAAGPEVSATLSAAESLMAQNKMSGLIAATSFAAGSTLFTYLFLRARSIPAWMAWLGVIASVLLVIALPVQIAGFLRGALTFVIWLPMLVFELVFAAWLIIKGVR